MTEQVVERSQARDLFRAAYENRYTWDTNFPGYTADVELRQGDEVYTSKVRVNRDLSYEVLEVSDETIRETMQSILWETVTHRKRSSFDQTHGKHSFDLGSTDETGAVEILVGGDAMGSNYRLRNNEISQVSRTMGGTSFTIDHKSSLNTDTGYISTAYNVVYNNAKTGEVTQQTEVENTYEAIGGYYLLTQQTIDAVKDGETTKTVLTFSNIQLL